MEEKTDLYILWTSDNPITAEKMVFMYSINSIIRSWWDNVTIIVWGAAATFAVENTDIQKKIKEAQEKGIHLVACKSCSDQLGITESLEKLGIEVDYTGALLTNILKTKEALITI